MSLICHRRVQVKEKITRSLHAVYAGAFEREEAQMVKELVYAFCSSRSL